VDSPRRILLRSGSHLRTTARHIHLKEITEDTLRESGQVQEKWFDIELPTLCSMRKDTKLVVVDIPGVNEAGSCDT
jgi:hypothetical protein